MQWKYCPPVAPERGGAWVSLELVLGQQAQRLFP